MSYQAPSSSQSPYVLPSVDFVTTYSLITTGDTGTQEASVDANWRFAGIPDGIGAFSNGDGTLTVVVNHELGGTAGVVREHGFKGAFVDLLRVNAETGEVLSGDDLAQQAFTLSTSPADYTDYVALAGAWNRFCSGDLAAPSAFFDAASGFGTTERIYLTGEENGVEGRAFAFVVSDNDASDGTAARVAYELPALGNLSFENLLANPASGPKTVVVSTDDTAGGQLYVYVGDKHADNGLFQDGAGVKDGAALYRAGLIDGKLYGVKVDGLAAEAEGTAVPQQGVHFTLAEIPNAASLTGAAIQTKSEQLGVTGFLRPEDGAWDPSNPNRFYFVTTDGFSTSADVRHSRLWSLEFDNVQDPLSGGKLKMLLDGTEGQQMFDNITVTEDGRVFLQEDPGNQAHIAKVWMYNPGADALTEVAHHDPSRFAPGAAGFLTQDEESSGILDVTQLMGDGKGLALLFDTQAHYPIAGELVEGGQLQLMRVDLPVDAAATIAGTNDADSLDGSNQADVIDGDFGDDAIRGGAGADRLLGNYGADSLSGGQGEDTLSGGVGDDLLDGGQGDDALAGDVGNDLIVGGQGNDAADGGVGDDQLAGDQGDDTLAGGFGADSLDGGQGADWLFGGNGDDRLIGAQGDDTVSGGLGSDLYVFSRGSGDDVVTDFQIGQDHIDLSGAKFLSLTEVDTDHDGLLDSTVLAYQGGSATFLGVLSASAGDFLA